MLETSLNLPQIFPHYKNILPSPQYLLPKQQRRNRKEVMFQSHWILYSLSLIDAVFERLSATRKVEKQRLVINNFTSSQEQNIIIKVKICSHPRHIPGWLHAPQSMPLNKRKWCRNPLVHLCIWLASLLFLKDGIIYKSNTQISRSPCTSS